MQKTYLQVEKAKIKTSFLFKDIFAFHLELSEYVSFINLDTFDNARVHMLSSSCERIWLDEQHLYILNPISEIEVLQIYPFWVDSDREWVA